MRVLIADSGSTKTHWVLLDEKGQAGEWMGQGINPALATVAAITALLPDDCRADSICFYGAGCKGEGAVRMRQVLCERYPGVSAVSVESDLLAAARSLCGNRPGVACILGTGANTCFYDGERIVENVPTLGYVLGDEGSGASLGRLLLRDVLRGSVSPAVARGFRETFGLDETEIVRRVYREPAANVFLASFCPFLAAHRSDAGIRTLLVSEFMRHLETSVVRYGRPELPVNYVGSVACHFQEELREAAACLGLTVGEIHQRPMPGLIRYHTSRHYPR